MPVTPVIDTRYCCFALRVAPSTIHRWGVYAAERIPARRKVIEYTGEIISRREGKRRNENRKRIYLFWLDNYWYRDGAVGGSGAELINHCCKPNLTTVIRHRHILYMSNRVIEPGEELTVDYHFGAHDEIHRCSCGARNCRGTINELPE